MGTLAFEEVRTSTEMQYSFTAMVFHGLLGSGRNWRSFSRSLASRLSISFPSSEWRIVLVDLRNHGRSAEIEGLTPPHTMESAAKDVANLVKSQGWAWPDVVLGHSMGGKVALQFAQSCAQGDFGASVQLPKQLWVLDSVPGKVSPYNSDGEVENVLRTLQTLPTSIPSRKWMVDHMIQLGFSKSLSEWIGSNLRKSGESVTWAFNLEGAVQMFNSYRDTDYFPLLEHPPKGSEIAVVRAEKSDRWEPDVVQRLEALCNQTICMSESKFSIHLLPNSGHWVHVDNPKGLLDIVAPRIATVAAFVRH